MTTHKILLRIQPEEDKTFQDEGCRVYELEASSEKLLGIAHGIRAAGGTLRTALFHGGRWKNILSLIGTSHERLRGRQNREGPYLLTDSIAEIEAGDADPSFTFDDYNFVYVFWNIDFVHGFLDAYLWLRGSLERRLFLVREVETGKTFRVR